VPCQNSFIAADLACFPWLGCSAVFADHSAEDLPALDPGGDIDGVAGLTQRGFLLQALVRTVAVIVPGVLAQRASGHITQTCRGRGAAPEALSAALVILVPDGGTSR
jgi:hypothetical protein